MNENIYWETEHTFYYNSTEPVTARALADNLLGIDGIAENAGRVLARLLQIKPTETQILVIGLKIGSYEDSLLFRFLLGKGEEAEAKLEQIRETLKVREWNPNVVVGSVIAGTILVGALPFVGYFAASGEEATPAQLQIRESFNNISLELNVSSDDLLETFRASVKPEQVKKDVVKLLNPGGTKHAGSIMIDGNENLKISEEIVEMVPVEYEKAKPTESSQGYESQQIIIRALDLDKPKSGWAVIVPEIHEGRLPLILDEDVDPDTLVAGKLFDAAITVISRTDARGEKKARQVILNSVAKPK